ncbi:phosphatidylinositol-3,5-bisphosphate 3-phosphatase MTMR4 [Choristoneura fumiferana]|uniref:phosphatidylinositol-3,5-bisphosphate 3-phosphatase MTMR4 n=1 Tax=Choristoneura fumiferana TaxID=7141 RepID=UPI003D154968
MLINTFLDTEDFVHLYYPEDEPAGAQGCGAGARLASKYPRPPEPEYDHDQVSPSSTRAMSERDRERWGAPAPPEPPPHRVRAADLYPRLRTHCDEPGTDVPFTPICGEFVQWVGRTADGGTVAMSNYRLHAQPRRRSGPGASVPLRLIDAVEVRDLLCLVVLCKHGRQLKCTFNTGEQCAEWWRRLSTALSPMGSVQETFAAAYAAWAKEQPPASVHRALMRASHAPHRYWFGPEVERLGFTTKGAWRVTAANADYKLCPSYPPLLVVPASIGDEDLDSVARFRAMRRIPAVVWRHRGNGAVIARSSQPEVGWLGWRSSEDERLLSAFVSACNADRGLQPPNTNKQTKLLIVDARSYASAVTNRARGGGCECQQYYPYADIQFMSLPNIHHVRRSFQQMRALAAEPSDQANWHSNLERTLWLQYVSGVCRAASVAARAVLAGRPVLVHCSDGWDRTPQIVAAAQLILDCHYRTVEGFRVLVEREWLDFGHKFADRCGHQFGPEEPNERSPIFLQWLDVVYQLMRQYPCSFEFNEAYLIKLGTHVHSCMFGTFLCNTSRERAEARAPETTAHVWQLLRAPAYRNHLYSPHHSRQDQVLWPEYGVRSMHLWVGMYCGDREEPDDEPPEPEPLPLPHTNPNGLMTKTRSCDNLLSEGEKRTTQRRCSDPSIAPDVMKLSSIMTGECDSRTTRALTDSCVDNLPAVLPAAADQVDGLHPDHFDNAMRLPRDLASGSSSLERELVGAVDSESVEREASDAAREPSEVSDIAREPSEVSDVVRAAAGPSPDGTPDDPVVFVRGFNDVTGLTEGPPTGGRSRHISITWRSISESSNQSSTGFDLPEPTTPNGQTNGQTNGVNPLDELEPKFLEVDLNGGTASSGASSEGEEAARPRVASQLTLCPGSPRRRCTHCVSLTSGIETSGESGASSECWCGVCGEGGAARARCLCGAGGAGAAATDPVDGLPPATDPMQARLHQIILYQKKVVEELTGQLRSAREALRRASPPPAAPARPSPSAPSPTQMSGSNSGRGSASGSSSGSLSEVEVGEEARGVVWLPDSAAPRCQHCRNHFWLARRRHHCRQCGGIFCGSCSEMSSWGACGAVRVCRRCRALR